MHAIRLHEFGPAENLRFERVPDPVPAAGQVRILVEASGVHLVDTVLRSGAYSGGPMPAPDLPTIPGREVAGTVDAVGAGVEAEWVGRRVVAHLGMVPGGYAETAVTGVDRVHEIPAHLDTAAAVAMIGTGRTAAVVLSVADLSTDDVVIVTAAAGGLGSLFVQEASNIGATVVGLAGGQHKTDLVRSLGADIVADYNDSAWPDLVRERLGGRQATVVLDGVGGDAGRAALDLLDLGGRFLLFGWSAGTATEIRTEDIVAKGLTVRMAVGMHLIERYHGGMRALESFALDRAASGAWQAVVTRFPLEKAAEAHLALENRGTTGKAVLIP
jgi:NADPH:quinone reductase